MPKSINQLKKLWEQEKEEYKKHEVGSGVQKFVKEVFKSPELFNLKEGTLSTPDEKRKNEFLEEKTKKAKRADVIIYIDPQIIIPVEVEKYQNITAGEHQILNYQRVWEKKYGLLIDGYEWIFYNNNLPIKTFTIDVIFNNRVVFLEYWKEYIQPKNYYLQFFEKAGQLKIFEEDLSVDKKRENFFKDITTLIISFKNKLNIKGYFERIGEEKSEKRAVEITYAYLIQFILYKTLVDNEFENFGNTFKQRLERIYKDLINENYSDILNAITAISDLISKNVYRPFREEQNFINTKLENIRLKPQNELEDVTPWLDIFIFIKRYSFANVKNEIFGYIYENYLKDLYSEKKKGQYFTDPDVVNFMLEQVGYIPKKISKKLVKDNDSISLVDPSCGSGTFLYSAVVNIMDAIPNGSQKTSQTIEKLVNENIFGLDIEEFPLYLAEMSIIMRMLPLIICKKYNNPIDKKIKVFKTNDSIAEFLDTAIRNTLSDVKVTYEKNKGQLSMFTKELNLGYSSYVRDEDDLKEMKKSLENQPKISRYRFDFVVGNPPYVTYNECSKQGLLIVKRIQDKTVQMSDIYGVNLNTVPGRIKAYAPKPNLYSFFMALGLALLKDNGKLCYIIPQTMLTASDLDVIRYHLARFTTIEKIITFSCKMFIGRGLKQDKPVATSSLIFIANRKPPVKLHSVEIINYVNPDDEVEKCLANIKKGNKINKNKILQEKLLQNVANWNFIKWSKEIEELFINYNKCETFDIYRLDIYSKEYFKSDFYFDKGLIYPKNKMKLSNQIADDDPFYYLINSNQKNFKLSISNQIIEKKNITLPKGAQGLKVYDKKYKVIWRYMNPNKFHFSDKKIMINHNWVLISSDNKNEIVYILSILNSKVTQCIFEKLFKSANEKSFQIGIKSIKEFCKIPKINNSNEKIKTEIINSTEQLLQLEDYKLYDLVNFSKVMIQKFDDCLIEKKNLVLIKEDKRFECEIKTSPILVQKVLMEIKGNGLFTDKISLSTLKNHPAIDFDKQNALRNYCDDLVFALYFDINIKKLSFELADEIKIYCKNHKFYNVVNN